MIFNHIIIKQKQEQQESMKAHVDMLIDGEMDQSDGLKASLERMGRRRPADTDFLLF